MRFLVVTIGALLISTLSLSAQDNKKDQIDKLKKEEKKINDMRDIDPDKIVSDYIRAGRGERKDDFDVFKVEGYHTGFMERISMSLGASTTDIGLTIAAPINERFVVRLGGGVLPSLFSMSKNLVVTDDALQSQLVGECYPYLDSKATPKFFNGKLLLSYYPVENLNFHITGGVHVGKNELEVKGSLIDPATGDKAILKDPAQGWPMVKAGKYWVNVTDGNIKADIRLGSMVKPYLGVGYGVLVPGGLSFNVDLGVLYQGGYEIYQDGKKAPKTSSVAGANENSAINIKKYTNITEFWPVIGVQMVYRIK